MEPQQINPTPEISPEVEPAETSVKKSKSHTFAIFCLVLLSVLYVFSSIYTANNNQTTEFVPYFDEERNCYWQAVDVCAHLVEDIDTWKTYRSEEYGYEFKYPNGSYVESNNGNIRIQNYNGYRQGLASGEFWLDFNEKPGKGSCQSEVTTLNKKQDDLGIYYIGALSFTEMNEAGGERFVLCADKSGNSIFIQAFENNTSGPLVNKILSTFKFIDSTTTDISTWKAYRNEEYGFEFKYPSNWVKLEKYQNDPNLITVVSSKEAVDRIATCYEGCGPDLWFYIHKNMNIEKYVSDPGNLIYKPKKTTIDNRVAYEAEEGGYSSYYVILIQNGKDIYEIFAYNKELSLLSDTVESQILKTFKFTK